MKEEKKDPLVDVLRKSFEEPKTYEDLVQDGVCMERLMKMPEFKHYQKLLLESFIALVRRMRLVDKESLPEIQGAMIQHDLIIGLPQKVLDVASRAVRQNREETETQPEEGEQTHRAYAR